MHKDVETQRSLHTLNYDIFPIRVDVRENVVKIYTQYREKRAQEKFTVSSWFTVWSRQIEQKNWVLFWAKSMYNICLHT